jgi:hypothetical protein
MTFSVTIKHLDGRVEVIPLHSTAHTVILLRMLEAVLEWLEAIHAKLH